MFRCQHTSIAELKVLLGLQFQLVILTQACKPGDNWAAAGLRYPANASTKHIIFSERMQKSK
jgi:hypothetical protein